ncbi:MAG: TlpA family protein disulfide reductase [candidate division Zixibacteria bacterium]|nr:TlpA family protein disulfide reductase [candidate division Zixibacteria bacterium]
MLLKKGYFVLVQAVSIYLLITGAIIFSCGKKDTPGNKTEEVKKTREGISEGEIAPDFTLKDLKGMELNLKEFRGKVVLLNFWATWCSPCRIEIPSMVELYKRYKDKGLEIIGVNLDKLGRSGVEQFSKEYNISFPVLLDPAGKVGTNYGIVALPTTFILDREGKILERVTGGLDWTTEENLKKFETLLAESE